MDSSDSTAVRAPEDRWLKYFWTAELLSLARFVVAETCRFWITRAASQPIWMHSMRSKTEEIRTRWLYASPLGALAVVFAIPIYLAYQPHEAKESRLTPGTTTAKPA